jgi:hypothetical protein
MVFQNLPMKDFGQFSQQFCDRHTKEVVTLCQVKGAEREKLAALTQKSCDEVQIGMGLDYNISADLYDASRNLQRIVENLGGYPILGVTEFSLGIKLNQEVLHKRSKSGTKLETVNALDVYREFWLARLGRRLSDLTPQ